MISIVIPTYEQRGKGAFFLTQLLESIKKQVINVPFEVVISDNSADNSIFRVVAQYAHQGLELKYKLNPVRGASENMNSAIDNASYDIIKIMCQDDLFTHHAALALFYNAFTLHYTGWVISNSVHINEAGQRTGRRVASYQHNNFESNTVGMPSVIAFRKCGIRFDTRLKTFCDLYFYHQLYELYGPPAVIQTETVAQRFHNASQSRNQPGSHKQDRQLLVREGKIPGHLPKVVVAVVVHDRWDNINRWIDLWKRCNTKNAQLVIIHNRKDYFNLVQYEHSPDYMILDRPNFGYDIGALQDVCRNRLPGFPDYDYLLWCTDDTIPMDPNFIWHFVDPFDNSVGCTCMHISREVTYHIRTTGFCIPKRVAERLKFPADPVTTKEQCLQFEHKGANRTMFKQILAMRLKALQVTANFEHAPVYDMGFWYRNAEAKKVAHLHDRMQEHYKIFPILSNEKVTT